MLFVMFSLQGYQMNIVRVLGKKSVLSSLVGCTMGILGIQYALSPDSVLVQSDIRWSPEIHQSLKKKFESLSLRTYGIKNLKRDIATEYPCLKDITIRYSSSLKSTVHLLGWRPIVRIRSSVPTTKEYVVCESNMILSKDSFNNETLHALPVITIVGGDFEEKRVESEFINMALNLHPSMFENYTISWHSKTQICFEDLKNPITIIADSLSVHDRERFDYVQRIYRSEEKYKNGMKADIRLKDSLVCTPGAKQSL